ncbi:MAG TPA: carboxypeptidase M32 [Thermoanaerobaculia bacterium]|nr:carboxypeptidase M32 [Thermoanaerobaculia bacterium]
MDATGAYEELAARHREVAVLRSSSNLLEWDAETMMPAGAAELRSQQLAMLAGLTHERATDPRLGELLELAGDGGDDSDGGDPESIQAANLREMRRGYEREVRLPRRLVEEMARVVSLSRQEWVEARKANDFARFRPWLEQVVALKRETAEALAPLLGFPDDPTVELYDALLDEYEPGARSREIASLFAALRQDLVPLAAALAAAPRRPRTEVLHRDFPVERQRAFGRAAAERLGFDFERGRMDVSAHPFCMPVGPGDTRLTTRYQAGDFREGFFGILHEVGHGLYEQGLDPAGFGMALGDSASLGLHESQSRLWENRVGRSRAFWEHLFPAAREAFPEALGDVSLDEMVFAVNEVAPGPNRVRADEVTYNLHVLVRFDLERALLDGRLAAADVPEAWNAAYREMLGLTPPDDADGCLQDTHWGSGLFGYFPTYTLGNVYAAQLFAAAERQLGDLDGDFRQGRFDRLLAWLRDNVHRPGRRLPAAEIVRRATGQAPDHRPLVEALRSHYGELYGI